MGSFLGNWATQKLESFSKDLFWPKVSANAKRRLLCPLGQALRSLQMLLCKHRAYGADRDGFWPLYPFIGNCGLLGTNEIFLAACLIFRTNCLKNNNKGKGIWKLRIAKLSCKVATSRKSSLGVSFHTKWWDWDYLNGWLRRPALLVLLPITTTGGASFLTPLMALFKWSRNRA